MAGTLRLAAVPEESTDGSAPPTGLYRDSIRVVSVSGAQIRWSTHFSSSQSGSSHSGASNSCPSNNSGCSFASGFFSAYELAEMGHLGSGFFSAHQLTEIAHRMVSDGYIQRMVQAFDAASPGNGGPDAILETWFCELDVGWVLQIGQQELPLQVKLDPSLQGLVERWIRGLTLMVHSIIELVSSRHEMTAAARFGKVSISKMLGFIDAIISHLKPEPEKLQAVLDMYVCFHRQDMYVRVFNASYMFTPVVTSPEAQSIFDEICGWLESGGNRLRESISSTMEEVIILMEEDESWAIEIPRGGGEIHKNTLLMVDCVMCMQRAMALVPNSEPWENLGNLINTMIDYLTDLLLRKSEMCLNPSLRYLFLLNNSYFVVKVLSKPSASSNPELWSRHHLTHKLAPECKTHMDCYLDVSWGHVLSYVHKSRFPGPIQRWIKTSPLSKFMSAFRKTYQAHKFWKVPDPWLRDALRTAITERVVSGYRDYLEEHPGLEKQVCFGRESNSSEVLKEMLGELFEG